MPSGPNIVHPSVGSPEAKLKIVCILPDGVECHDGVLTVLKRAANTRPAKIRLDFKYMSEYAPGELDDLVGTTCAAVQINGKFDFTLKLRKGMRDVRLVGTVPMNYTLHQLGEALQQVYESVHGDPGEAVYVLTPDAVMDDGSPDRGPPTTMAPREKVGFEVPKARDLGAD